MCRIAGIVTQKKHSLKNYLRVRAMCDSLAHGGPDDDGIFLDQSGKVCLGHRRLSILDLTDAGHQPMEHNNIWISYNGEIYNFIELRNELKQAGYEFQSGTDTEVILKAYQCWGTSAFERFEGMFAFAIADLQTNKTYLVRGPEGIKPLYYSADSNKLVFSSEVRAIQKSGYNFPQDPNWKILFLAFGHLPEPFTTLEGVRMLPKGHFLEWHNQSGEYLVKRFSAFKYCPTIKDPQAAVEAVKSAVKAAVRRHLISDAPIGVFLSGGIDSSILTLIADQEQGHNLRTLSVNFEEAEFNERRYQQLISGQTSAEHSDFLISAEELEQNFAKILESMDQPSTDGINAWFISKYAKEAGLKAVLSGLGADELFGGYPSFNRSGAIRWLKKLPNALLKATEKHRSSKIKRISFLSLKNPIGEYLFLRGFFTAETIAKLLDIGKQQVLDVLEACPISSEVYPLKGGNRISWLEANCYMQNQLLKDSDFMSMSHGIELRVPFLDHKLVKTILSIDPKIKFNKTQKKKLLIEAFADILPSEVWERKKMGFTFPFQKWMRDMPGISDANLYPNGASKALITVFKKGRLHWSGAFALFLLKNAAAPAGEEEKPKAELEPLRLKAFTKKFYQFKNQDEINYSLN